MGRMIVETFRRNFVGAPNIFLLRLIVINSFSMLWVWGAKHASGVLICE